MTTPEFFLVLAWIAIAAALAAVHTTISVLILFGAGMFYMLVSLILKGKEHK